MSLRRAFLLLCTLGLSLTASSANAGANFVFLRSLHDPANFQTAFNTCIGKFQAAGGLSASIISQLNNAEVVISYSNGGSGTVNPTPGANPTGTIQYVSWNSGSTGQYSDKAPKVPCAILLHELQHALRFFKGTECTGQDSAANFYDESMATRAENYWLSRLGVKQRQTYDGAPLGRWTRWPAIPSSPVPRAPPCDLCGGVLAVANSTEINSAAPNAACRRCTNFHQAGCFDFHGGIYSGGDHRRVAFGSLKIIVGDEGYCQGRKSCEFKDCYVCPHLDTAFPAGVTVTAIATPGANSAFAQWGPGACKGQGPTCTFTARKKSCINAQFLLTNPTAPPQSLPAVPCTEDP
jgi:hypothetical protein